MRKRTGLNLVIIVLLLISTSGCSIFKRSGQVKSVASYQSYANSQAEISLELRENLKFDYFMVIYPEPDMEETTESFSFKGRWKVEDDNYVLQFHHRRKPDLYALFDPSYDPKTTVRVIDQNHISFPVDDKEISIWGILCFKKEKEQEERLEISD